MLILAIIQVLCAKLTKLMDLFFFSSTRKYVQRTPASDIQRRRYTMGFKVSLLISVYLLIIRCSMTNTLVTLAAQDKSDD